MNIKGKEFSEETIALALEAYVLGHPEPKPELRHGDYGTLLGSFYFIDCNHPDQTRPFGISDSGGQMDIDRWANSFIRLGNIFDDLARNKVDLEKFEITTHHGGTLRMRIDDTIEFLVHNGHHATASLAEAIELYQKLGQMIATAKRKTK